MNFPLASVATGHALVPGRHSRNVSAIIFCLFSVMSFPRLLAAAEWSLAPSINVEVGRNDNPTLTTGSSDTVSVVSFSPQIKMGRKTETSNVDLNLLLDATKYSGDEVPDTDTQILSFSSLLRTTERTEWSLNGELRRDILFRTIHATPDTGDLQDTDVGLVSRKVRRDRRTARPSWRYALSERSSLGLSYGITDVSFSDAVGTGLVDYKDHQVSATYSRRITRQDDLNMTVSRFAYRPAENNTESDSTRLLAGISHAYSETARGRFLAGVGKTSEKFSAGTEDTSSLVLEAGITQQSELTTFDGVISRDVQPGGLGRSMISNQFRVYLARRISPTLDVVVRTRVFRNKVLEGSDPGIDRRYYEFEPALRWSWRSEWSISTQYQYRRQKFDADPEPAKSNALSVSVTYAWPQHVVSR